MPRFSNITNIDKNIEEKVNYFIDCFQHFNIYAGAHPQFEIESPYSLVQKIMFNLEQGKSDKVSIFEHFFSHKNFEEPEIWSKLPAFPKVKSVIDEFSSAPAKERKKLLDSASLHRSLGQLLEQLEHQSADILFEALMRVILCKEDVHAHEHMPNMEFLAGLMVSEAYFTGKTMNDVAELVDRIFQKNIKTFPFPAQVREKDYKKYLHEGNLTNQLSGFKTIMERQRRRGNVIKKAFCQTAFPDDFFLEYNGVSFFGPKYAPMAKLREVMMAKNGHFKDFFAPGHFIYVMAEIDYFSNSSIRGHFEERTESQLNFLSSMIEAQVELEAGRNLIVVSPRWRPISWDVFLGPRRPSVDTYAIARFAKNNPYSVLGKADGKARDWLLKFEPLFVDAHRKKDIAGYWKYLEALLPENAKGEKQVRSLVSRILLLDEQRNTRQRVVDSIRNAASFFYGGNILFNIPIEKIRKAESELYAGRIPTRIRKSEYQFVKTLLGDFDRDLSPTDLGKFCKYYDSILAEAYNVRNFEVHAGISNECSILKISRTFPSMVVRLRWLIFERVKQEPSLPFQILISKMLASVEKLMQKE